MMDDREAALQAWLSLEREAVWVYPFIGARVPALADRSRLALAAHRATRDRLVTWITDDTTTARAAYDIGPISSVSQGEAAARDLEKRIQTACLSVLQLAPPEQRERALKGLRTAAAAEMAWGGNPHAFPGLD